MVIKSLYRISFIPKVISRLISSPLINTTELLKCIWYTVLSIIRLVLHIPTHPVFSQKSYTISSTATYVFTYKNNYYYQLICINPFHTYQWSLSAAPWLIMLVFVFWSCSQNTQCNNIVT